MASGSRKGEDPTPRPRTRRGRAADASIARILKMPPGHHDYVVTPAVRVPMRDGVELLTDVYSPVAESRGTLLIRTPYGRTGLIALLTARHYATHGYHVVNQSCRGTFGSGGVFEPFEPDDRRRRRHCRLAAETTLVRWTVRSVRSVVPRVHGLGLDDGSATGAGGGRDRHLRARQPLGGAWRRSLLPRSRCWASWTASSTSTTAWSRGILRERDGRPAAEARASRSFLSSGPRKRCSRAAPCRTGSG